MKVIFLDFDGVIALTKNGDAHGISLDLVDLLNDIILSTNAKVVVSSDWRRHRSITDLQSILVDKDFLGMVIDKTDDSDNFDCRSDEIHNWLNAHPDITSFIILDDLDLFGFGDKFLQTDPTVGLTPDLVKKAISLLNK